MKNNCGTKALLLALLTVFLCLPYGAEAYFFSPSDLAVSVLPNENTISPGDTAAFSISITNLSTETIMWGENLWYPSTSVGGYIDGIIYNRSPYVDGTGFLLNVSEWPDLVQNQSFTFDYYYIDTKDSIPDGSKVHVAPVWLGFENMPAQYPDDKIGYDFEIRTAAGAETIVSSPVPEPSAIILLATGLFGIAAARRRIWR